jgi:streptogramin lyase
LFTDVAVTGIAAKVTASGVCLSAGTLRLPSTWKVPTLKLSALESFRVSLPRRRKQGDTMGLLSKDLRRLAALLMAAMPLAIVLVALVDVPVALAGGPPGLNLQVITPSPPAQDVYISDQGNNRVLKVTPSGVQTPIGSGLSAPSQVAVDAAGDVYIADTDNNRIVEVTPAGVQTTVLGSGLNAPQGVAADAAGDVYIANTNNNRVIEHSPDGAQTSIGTGLSGPTGVVVDAAGNVFIADEGNNRVVEVDNEGLQTTVGRGFFGPQGIGLDPAGDVFVADTKDDVVHTVRKDAQGRHL